jgi:PAS domain S-box-containing protein
MASKDTTPSNRGVSNLAKVRRATARLVKAEADLLALTGGQIGAVVDQQGGLLLPRTQEALRKSQALNAAVLDSALDAIVVIDHEGRIIEFNSAATKIFGHDRADILLQSLAEVLIPPAMREAHRRGLAKCLSTGHGPMLGRRIETSALRADGTEFPIALSITQVSIEGSPLFIGHIRDLSELQQAESTRAELAAVVQFSNDAIIGKTLGGIIVSWNKAAEQLYGYSADEMKGRSITLLASPDRKDELPKMLKRVGCGEQVQQFETTRVRKDGRQIHVSLSISPIRNSGGKIIGASTVSRNITERKLAEEAHLARNKERQMLHEVGHTIFHAADLKTALDKILEQAIHLGSFDMGVIRLIDDRGALKPASMYGVYDVTHITDKQLQGGENECGPLLSHLLNSAEASVVESVSQTRVLPAFKEEGVQSSIVVPVQSGQQLIGSIQLGSRTTGKFSFNEIRLLESLGNYLGVAVQKYRSYEEIQKYSEHIRVLHDIASAVSSTLDLRAVFEILLAEIDRFFRYPCAVTVRLLNNETGDLQSVASRNIDHLCVEGESTPLHTRAKAVIETKEPVLVRDLLSASDSERRMFYALNGLVSLLAVPLLAKSEVLGVLGFYTKVEHEFTTEEIDVLETLAGQAAIAIQNAQLFEKIDLSRRELERSNRYLEKSLKQLSGLYTALTPLAASESLNDMMVGIIERLIDATGAHAALIRVWDQTTGMHPIVAQQGFPDYYLERMQTAPRGGAVEWVINHGEPIIAPSIASEARLTGKVQLQMGFHSCAILPLKVHGDVRGVFHLSSRKLGYFDEEQKAHLGAIARQMGTALENRELYDDLRSSRDRLAKADKVKSEFLSVMSHELRTPLNVIMGFISVMRDKGLGDLTSEQEKVLDKVKMQAAVLLSMINSVMEATKMESGAVSVEKEQVDLTEFLDELKATYEFCCDKQLTLVWRYPLNLPYARTDPRRLKMILQNLINNAIKFTPSGTVAISTRVIGGDKTGSMPDTLCAESHETQPRNNSSRDKRHVEFVVVDTGIGIGERDLPFIFDMFRQVDSSETRMYGGVGLGLYIVKKAVDLLGGQIEVKSKPGEGSKFRVIIDLDANDPA